MEARLIMFKDDERRDFPVKSGKVVVGRRLECDLRIPTNDVSREHCEISSNGVILKVKDLGSSNGTFVNGRRVTEAQLKAGDKLGVGPVVFVVQIDGEPAKITPHDARVEAPAPEPAAATAGNHDDTGEFDDDDIFAEITGAGGDDGEEVLELDELDFFEDDDDEK